MSTNSESSEGGILTRAIIVALAAAIVAAIGWIILGGSRSLRRPSEAALPPSRKIHPTMRPVGSSGAVGDEIVESLTDEELQRLLDELGGQL